MKKLAALFLCLVLIGCAGAFVKPEIGADYGPEPQGFETALKEYFCDRLKDCESARYKFGEPFEAYQNYGFDLAWKGWIVPVDVNAKNGFGGYTGFQTHYVKFRKNTPVDDTTYFSYDYHVAPKAPGGESVKTP